MRVIWKPQAVKDLEAIEEYYLKVAPKFADILIDEIHHQTDKLKKFPKSGRKVPEINDPAIREVIHKNYRIIYHVSSAEEKVEILTVYHSSREFG
ncbi:MAG: type II toxin-antitoxin system mRNA interferase toxin, RelE/StbE family [Bacteroidetes bacterium]|jgi:addiction module RelE/StbE family toxin|nr:type II toxin-antitoxin system mRNA interferase toxin, RelE/StbE family [Bacteroidota bacterium]